MMSTLVERVSRWPCISTYFKSLKGVPTGVDSDANQSLRTFESGGFCTFGIQNLFLAKVGSDEAVLLHSRVKRPPGDACGFCGVREVAVVFLELALNVGALDLM